MVFEKVIRYIGPAVELMVFEKLIRYSPRRRASHPVAEGFSPTARLA